MALCAALRGGLPHVLVRPLAPDEDAEGEIDEELLLEAVMDVEPDFYLSDPEEAEPDVAMPDVELEMEMLPVLSASWVVLGESQPESRMQSRSEAEQEWEMVE
ncbi:hypothetical protein FB45DRAFT_1036067 [Roridomyces roridus]|uniref:Uncharacterized protein n=1 Tax=Roridomyces roridus TaxID=1738132 RepID=A0AAD7B9E3_9AGAR|nr:hypothetical protein FB45DRAFT_1036067 [Roridomyces roridus]